MGARSRRDAGAEHCLVGRRWGRTYRLGERVSARLLEAEPITGGLILELLDDTDRETPGPGKPRSPGGRVKAPAQGARRGAGKGRKKASPRRRTITKKRH